MFRWSKPGAAALLAGWAFLAPVCGALKWRPHVWINGGAGSGKSTILNDFVAPLLGAGGVLAQGNSTEAGIRQKLKADALPVIFDESEQNNEQERKRIEGILALIRQASTDSAAQTLKGTIGGDAMNFHVRSMFCLASIQVGMTHKADQDRLTKLTLVKAEGPEAPGEWDAIKEQLHLIATDKEISERLLRRAIDLLPTTHKNITVFIEAAAKKFGTQRMGDQYGTLLAGCWTLASSEVATPAQAVKMIDSYDWSEFTDGSDLDDCDKCLNSLLAAKIVHKGDAMSVASLVALSLERTKELPHGVSPSAITEDGLSIDPRTAIRLLRENGINIGTDENKVEMLLFKRECDQLKKLLGDSQFTADIAGQLKRVKGAKAITGRRFGPGGTHRAIGIPLLPLGLAKSPV
jgi:putative DNA primase/helicase